MICNCGEKAFTFTQISSRDGKKYTCLVGRCNRTSEETNKKKKKCDFKGEQVIETCDLPGGEMKSVEFVSNVKTRETKKDYIKQLDTVINTIKICQEVGQPFDKYINRVLYLSKKLNIPPYIENKHTIDEYYKIAVYYLKNPIPVRKPYPAKKYSLINTFLESIKTEDRSENYKWRSGKRPRNFKEATDEELYEHFKKLLTTKKPTIKVKPNNRVRQSVFSNIPGKFKTGGINVEEVQEDELDIEEFDSEDEQDSYDDGYMSN